MDSTLTVQRLTEIGLSKYEASAYLALLGHDDSTAVEVADRACVPRQRIYDVLISLRDKGLIIISAGRPARHVSRPPGIALPAMYQARLRAQAQENERIARIVEQLVPQLEAPGNGSELLDRIMRAAAENIGGF
ncbi:MAG: TrmB family transcriptional regulator [Chloroflexi bacterium]|nr:TrmB family transcriptional regulator [Chloroflexota bacterium]MBI3761332.1 TrmB family transcriptional regulator [Chloroflexota bacterium]